MAGARRLGSAEGTIVADSLGERVSHGSVAVTADVLGGDMRAGAAVAELLTWLVGELQELLDGLDIGVMLVDGDGDAQPVVSSNDRIHRFNGAQAVHRQGPAIECLSTGVKLGPARLGEFDWPALAPASVHPNFAMFLALPMRAADGIIGAVVLVGREGVAVPRSALHASQALVDACAYAIVRERGICELRRRAAQLQHALDSRIVIEQAKGIVAERLTVDVDVAFDVIRRYARSNNQKLDGVARAIIHRRLGASELWDVTRSRSTARK